MNRQTTFPTHTPARLRPGVLVGLLLVLATVIPPASAEAKIKIESHPISSEMTLDGETADWEEIPIVYLEESLRVMSVAHDDDNLYLMYRFADERLARRLMAQGVMLWFNGDGKAKNKNEEFAVRYRGSEQISQRLQSTTTTENQTGSDSSGRPARRPPANGAGGPTRTPGQLTIIRMSLKETVDEGSLVGPGAASKFDEGIFTYELRVPLAEIGGSFAEKAPSKTRKIAVGIQLGGLTEAEKVLRNERSSMGRSGGGSVTIGGGGGGMGGGRGGGMGGGMGGGRGGGMGGGRGGGPGNGRPNADTKIEWLSLTLPPSS